MFPQYTDKKPITRKIKRTICPDIFHLGNSIVNREPARELGDETFSSKDCDQGDVDNQVGPETEMATLLQVVSDLTRRMRVLEKRLATVEAQKEELDKLTKVHESTDKETDSYASDTHSKETSPSRRVTLSSGGHSSSSDSEDGRKQRKQRRKQRRKLQQADPSVKLQVKVNTLKADASAQTQCRPTNTGVTVKNGRSLKSAIKTLDMGHKEIYIGGVDSENSADDVRDHLHKMGVRDAVVTELANRPNWKSYKAVEWWFWKI